MCDKLFNLSKEVTFNLFKRIDQFKICPYCGISLKNKTKCPIHNIPFKKFDVCGGIEGSEILEYFYACHICGWKLNV